MGTCSVVLALSARKMTSPRLKGGSLANTHLAVCGGLFPGSGRPVSGGLSLDQKHAALATVALEQVGS